MPTTWPYAASVLNIIELVDFLSSADFTVKTMNSSNTKITMMIPKAINALFAFEGGHTEHESNVSLPYPAEQALQSRPL